MACYIFGAGDFDGLEERPGAEDYVIAADGTRARADLVVET